jgi:hypothetical protein
MNKKELSERDICDGMLQIREEVGFTNIRFSRLETVRFYSDTDEIEKVSRLLESR